MSNNLVSQQLSAQSIHVGQLEHNPNEFHSSTQMGFVGDHALQQLSMPMLNSGSTDALSQEISMPNDKLQQPLGYTSNRNVSSNLMFQNMEIGQMTSQPYRLVSQQFLLPNKQSVVAGNMLNQTGSRPSITAKRKEPMEPTELLSQKLSVPNKKVSQMDHRPWLQHISTSNRLPVQMQSSSNTVGSQQSQPVVSRPFTVKSGFQQQSVQKGQSRQQQASPKVQSGSFESVRSKLRESLAAALALVSLEQDRSSQSGKSASGADASVKTQKQESTQSSKETSSAGDVSDHLSGGAGDSWQAADSLALKTNGGQNMSTAEFVHAIEATKSSGQEYRFNNIFHEGEIPYSENVLVKDDFLQGNGLSWVLESDAIAENMDFDSTQERENVDSQSRPQAVDTPENLASKIEAELFKLFGGVNKKYKEKGRSLIFNLKDRNNPELRESVVLGEIPPERLCSMSAEELASKELSQWRVAKAEELAQMVVLPDSDGDMRRLVKKTHKGEVQVDFEEQDTVAAEVAVGSSSIARTREVSEKDVSSHKTLSKTEDREAFSGKSVLDHKNALTISSSEGGDLMQGLMVDDAMKDAEFLPPIVSLDEFMESLNSDPPFEDLPVDAGVSTPVSAKESSPVGTETKPLVGTEKKPPVGSPKLKGDELVASTKTKSSDMANTGSGAERKQVDSEKKLETRAHVGLTSGGRVWEGSLQLNISSMVSVTGVFKSGERTATEDWMASVEIKGRVRLDAFDKFLQGLPMSRSRAFMIVHFACSEGSTESERASLCEVTDSYVLDERVGYAEPASGVELYLCPPHSITQNMLAKVLSSDQVNALNTIDKGLIGVVVWRKPQSISPNSLSYYKHSSKKQQHLTSRRHQEKDNENVNAYTLKHPRDGQTHSINQKYQPVTVHEDDDDDVPPGFGPPPGFNRDEDDLPEFNFTSGSITPKSRFNQNSAPVPNFSQLHPAKPVDQMRELIQKYGQTNSSSSLGNWKDKRGTQTWNEDDDDDMPEWKPEETRHYATHTNPAMLPAPLLQHTANQQVDSQGIFQAMSLPPHNLQGNPVVPLSGPYTNGVQFQGTPGHLSGPPPGMSWNRDLPKRRGY